MTSVALAQPRRNLIPLAAVAVLAAYAALHPARGHAIGVASTVATAAVASAGAQAATTATDDDDGD